ncbi:MAG TPA: winged helix-turn-helix domain-containing protein [Micromonosporaceae bacterium]
MTVTPIHGPRPQRSRATAVVGGDPGWTLTLDLRVSGSPDPAILDLMADLRRLVDRAGNPEIDGRMVRIDVAARTVHLSGRPIMLSRLEFDLLLFLAENPGRVHTRERLLHKVWGDERSGTRTVDVHVRRLRAKSGGIPLVTTVRSIGYRLASDARVHLVR